MAEQSRNRSRHTVPVVSRDSAHRPRRRPRLPKVRLNTAEIAVLVVVTILILITIAVPLRNYYQGRSEIARLNESIAAKQREKEELLAEIDKYQDEAYIKEQARTRLGLIEPGETAFRIIDPRMDQEHTVTTSHEELEEERTWYVTLWDSVATPPAEDPGGVLMEE